MVDAAVFRFDCHTTGWQATGSQHLPINQRRNNAGGAEMEQLIEAALAHAKQLRQGAYAADGRGALVTIKEAERWERLATAAQAELSALDRD
jgi:hypothetical protein